MKSYPHHFWLVYRFFSDFLKPAFSNWSRRNQQEAQKRLERANRTPSPTITQKLANGFPTTSIAKTPFKEKKARKKAAKKSPKKSEEKESFFPKKEGKVNSKYING